MTFGRASTRILDFYPNFYVYVENKSWVFRETCFWTLVFFVRLQRRDFAKKKTQVGVGVYVFVWKFLGALYILKNKSWFFRETCFWTLVFFCKTSRQRLCEKHRLKIFWEGFDANPRFLS